MESFDEIPVTVVADNYWDRQQEADYASDDSEFWVPSGNFSFPDFADR